MALTLDARKGLTMTDDTPERRSGPLGERIILVGVDAWNTKQELVWLPEAPPPPAPIDVARNGLTQMVDDVLGADSSVAKSVDVVEGHASKGLVERSRHAELLVARSRGHGGFDGMSLGSVR